MTLFFHALIMLSVCCFPFVQGSYLMETVAGNGSTISSGNGGPATSAGLSPVLFGVWVDSLGNIFIPDSSKYQLRKVDTSGIISRYIGSGTFSSAGNSGPALSVALDGAACAYGDTAGNIYLSSRQFFIWKYDHTSGQVSRFAGATPANRDYSGDGGPATSASLAVPLGLFLSTNGILYFADTLYSIVRAIDTSTNIITTFAGLRGATALGDGGPATSAKVYPYGMWGNTAGVIYIGDSYQNRIRAVATDGIITTVVGTGTTSYNGDDIPATTANLQSPYNCQGDSLGNLYISDFAHFRVRMVSADTGNITTIAGNGLSTSANGSVHVATAVGMLPGMIQLDSGGNIYFGDVAYVRKLVVAQTGTPTTAPSHTPSAEPTYTSTAVPSAVPTAPHSNTPSTAPSAIPTVFPSFRPSTVNVTVDSSSSSDRLSDLNIFYATFFPAFFVVFCILLPIVGYYLWNRNPAENKPKYGEINLDDPSVTAKEKKIVEVQKFYQWSL